MTTYAIRSHIFRNIDINHGVVPLYCPFNVVLHDISLVLVSTSLGFEIVDTHQPAVVRLKLVGGRVRYAHDFRPNAVVSDVY